MSIVKFKDLPGAIQDAAVQTLSGLIIQGGPQLASEALALKVRDAFTSLYVGNENQVSAFFIQLDKAEIQSGVSRVKWAEGLIRQLPEGHGGRNSWLLNYGSKE